MLLFTVDLKPLVELTFEFIIAPVALGLAGWIGTRVLQLLHINTQSAIAKQVLTAAENGASLALSKGESMIDDHAIVQTKSQLVDTALEYVKAAVPDAIKKQGLDTPAGQAHLTSIVEAKLQQMSTPKVVLPVPPPTIGAAQ